MWSSMSIVVDAFRPSLLDAAGDLLALLFCCKTILVVLAKW